MVEEEDSWIYDSVVGFLNSPIWMVPIESFVDQHCLVFDGSIIDQPEYQTFHTQYKTLVEELLESFTNDLHITSEQFIGGCQKGRAATSSYTQGMFEYVFASVNYDLFKSIMVRHNAALSLQALQMIKGGSAEGEANLEEEVMKFSEQEFKTHREEFDLQSVKEMADLEAALKKSRLDCECLLKDMERDKSVLNEGLEEKKAQRFAPSAPFITADESTPPVPPSTAETKHETKHDHETKHETKASKANSSLDSLPPLRVAPTVQVNDNAAQKWMEEAKSESASSSTVQLQAPPQQTLEERRLYWQKRKQEIVESKRKISLETLHTHEPQGSTARPKSARVAQRAVETAAQPPSTDQAAVQQPPEAVKKPAMSQALAEALRREVVRR